VDQLWNRPEGSAAVHHSLFTPLLVTWSASVALLL